jgi:tripartite-type tricarboxylate transporter receptor subunit TctC
MVLSRRQVLGLATAGALLPRGARPAAAAELPSKPVTLICPWPPGGSTDVTMRSLAEATAKHLGQPIVVENKPGGSGTVGPATMAATGKPDGYTITQLPITVFRLPFIQKVTWDPLRDFSYILHVSGYVFGVAVKADSPWKTWPEFVDHAKANPGKVTYASPGAGTTLHITMEMLARKDGIKWTHVPFKGSAETIPAVLGGHVMAVADSTSWASQVDAGNLRLLNTWGTQWTKKWPKVPTLKELGYGIVSNSTFGFGGPKGMDPKLVKTLHDAFRKGMDDPAYQKTLDQLDMEPFYLGTDEYVKYVKQLVAESKEQVDFLGMGKKS